MKLFMNFNCKTALKKIIVSSAQFSSKLFQFGSVTVSVAKCLNYKTNSNSYKQLYRRQRFHYSARVSSVLIQFNNSDNVKMMFPSDSVSTVKSVILLNIIE